MTTTTVKSRPGIAPSIIFPGILVLVSTWIAASVLAGNTLPLLDTPRSALIAVLVLGMVACSGGIGQVGASGRWDGPLAITGYLLGVGILLTFAAGLFGWNLFQIEDTAQAVAVMAGLMIIKFLISAFGYFRRAL